MSQNLLKKFEKNRFNILVVGGSQGASIFDKDLKNIKYNVPGDPSSAAFFITAACLKPGSKLIIKNMLYNKTRIGFIKTLKKMASLFIK